MELIYVKSGELILSNQIHAFRTESQSDCWIAVFSEDFVPKFTALVKNKQGEQANFGLSDSTHHFVQYQLTGDDSSLLMKMACFHAICAEYISQVKLVERKASNLRIGNILDYIAEHYKEDLSLESIAQIFGYEYHYLSRLLNRDYHINFRELINEYRIEEAKDLLESGNLKITDIALTCGFQSIRHFNYVFKKITGISPNEYLQLCTITETSSHQ